MAAASSSSLPPPSASTAPRNSPRPHPPPHCAATKTPPLHRPGGAPGFSARAGPRCVLGSLSALRSLGRRWRRRRFRNYASRRAPRQRGNPEAERGRRGARGPAVELARVFPGDGGSEAPPWRVGAALLPPPPLPGARSTMRPAIFPLLPDPGCLFLLLLLLVSWPAPRSRLLPFPAAGGGSIGLA